jgi:hypothetical protein
VVPKACNAGVVPQVGYPRWSPRWGSPGCRSGRSHIGGAQGFSSIGFPTLDRPGVPPELVPRYVDRGVPQWFPHVGPLGVSPRGGPPDELNGWSPTGVFQAYILSGFPHRWSPRGVPQGGFSMGVLERAPQGVPNLVHLGGSARCGLPRVFLVRFSQGASPSGVPPGRYKMGSARGNPSWGVPQGFSQLFSLRVSPRKGSPRRPQRWSAKAGTASVVPQGGSVCVFPRGCPPRNVH